MPIEELVRRGTEMSAQTCEQALLELIADSTREEVPKRWKSTEQKDGAILDLAVRLPQRSQRDVPLGHGRRSAAVYSGSLSP